MPCAVSVHRGIALTWSAGPVMTFQQSDQHPGADGLRVEKINTKAAYRCVRTRLVQKPFTPNLCPHLTSRRSAWTCRHGSPE